MDKTSRAVIARRGEISVVNVPQRPVGASEARVLVAYSGICGSDLHTVDESDHPTVPGHEQSGLVAEVGNAVTTVRPGQRVAMLPRLPCGHCPLCRRGSQNLCRDMRRPQTGGWADEMVLDAGHLVPIPDDLALRDAALCEPLACVLHAVDQARISPGSSALILGGGPMGLLLVGLLPRCGIRNVLVSEPNPARRSAAQALGAAVADPTSEDLPGWIDLETKGRGVEVVFEAAGLVATVDQAIQVAGVGATVVVVGVAARSALASFSPRSLFERELTIRAAWGVETSFTRALTWLPQLDLDKIVSAIYPLGQAVTAVEAARNGSSGKILLHTNLEEQ